MSLNSKIKYLGLKLEKISKAEQMKIRTFNSALLDQQTPNLDLVTKLTYHVELYPIREEDKYIYVMNLHFLNENGFNIIWWDNKYENNIQSEISYNEYKIKFNLVSHHPNNSTIKLENKVIVGKKDKAINNKLGLEFFFFDDNLSLQNGQPVTYEKMQEYDRLYRKLEKAFLSLDTID